MDDYTDYMVRSYISGSVDEARGLTTDTGELALLDYTEKYLLDLYSSGQMVAEWSGNSDKPTLTMAQPINNFTDSGIGAVIW